MAPSTIRRTKIDPVGLVFGRLTVIAVEPKRMWRCLCECGREHAIRNDHLIHGHVVSCGCRPHFKDLTDMRFGKLLVIEATTNRTNRSLGMIWRCLCECGSETMVSTNSLTTGNTRSCGCLNADVITKHGHARDGEETGEYGSWCSMRERCMNTNVENYPRYGGRGISICDRWSTFAGFLADMGPRPAGHTLDRLDNEGDYEPGNCRWATPKEQANNRSNSRH